jgi:protease-4
VGSIGITASYNDYTKYNDKEGITYVPLYVGDYKELGTPYAPLTKEGKQVLMDQLQKSYEAFVTTVATYRKLPYEDVRKLANGLAFDARFALDNHLIDEIGGRDEVRAYLATKIGEPAVLCPNW